MLPSNIQPYGPAASGAALTVAPEAKVANSAARAADTLASAVSVADGLLGLAQKTGLVSSASSRKAKRSKSSHTGYAGATSGSSSSSSTTTRKSSSAAKRPGPLAFLDDPKLSVEDKLMQLLAYLNDKWEKEMEKKMKEMSPGGSPGTSKTSSSSASKGSGGILGSVVNAAKKFFPEVGVALELLQNPVVHTAIEKLGGPVLAAAASAVGMPALAPALLKYGPQLADAAAGIASGLVDGTKGSSASSAGGASSSGPAGASQGDALSDGQERLKLMEIQRIYDKQKEMFSLVSNILRSAHDTRMAVIQNVR